MMSSMSNSYPDPGTPPRGEGGVGRRVRYAANEIAPGTGAGNVFSIIEALKAQADERQKAVDAALAELRPLTDEPFDADIEALETIDQFSRHNWDTICRTNGYTARRLGIRWGEGNAHSWDDCLALYRQRMGWRTQREPQGTLGAPDMGRVRKDGTERHCVPH